MEMASLDSKCSELIDFLRLFRDFKGFEPTSDDTKKLKSKVMNKTHQLSNKYFNTYKEEYDSKDLKEAEKNFQCKILGKKKQKLESTLKSRLKESLKNQYGLK